MRRIFVNAEALQEEQLVIEGAKAHHLGRVLRLAPGTQVIACCGDGREYLAELQLFQKDRIVGQILSESQQQQETSVAVTIYQGMPKGDKLEWIIQKCTELGVSRIVPVASRRAVVKLDPLKGQKKQERWQKIALEASQQSKRRFVPEISAPIGWSDMLEQLAAEALTIILWEEENSNGLKQILEQRELPEQINLVIGPEGGLDAEEVAALKHKGAISVTLGGRILRTETAGLAALSMIFYHSGDLG